VERLVTKETELYSSFYPEAAIMNTDDLRDVVARLDALESLTKLFKNLWFDHIKGEIQDEKTKAYLMVFDDAFPGVEHVIEFMRKNAKAISTGEKVQEGFEVFAQTLLKREIETNLDFEEDFDPELFEEESIEDEEIEEEDLTEAEREALETVGQGDIDALFVEESNSEAEDASNEEIKAFLSADMDAVVEDEEELLVVEEEAEADDVDLEDLLSEEDEAEEAEADDVDLEDLLSEEDETEEVEGDDVDLEDLLSEEDEAEEVEGDDVDLGDLLSEEDEEEEAEGGDVDLGDLLSEEDEEDEESEGMSASISEEEMAALLGDDEEKPPPKAKAKKKPAKPDELEIDDAGNGEESISQDEIDALFG
jgi:pilus assembly protein FimV